MVFNFVNCKWNSNNVTHTDQNIGYSLNPAGKSETIKPNFEKKVFDPTELSADKFC